MTIGTSSSSAQVIRDLKGIVGRLRFFISERQTAGPHTLQRWADELERIKTELEKEDQ